ncbi:Major facilitator superfamily domain [Phytophthora cactorum]|nr:Major facilitator superfamily domain [Phytophthora cactorum]
MSVGEYLKSRITTLKPPMQKAENPFKVLRLLNRLQWMQFLIAFIAWSWDAFDFFTVSMTIEELAEEFDKSKTDITWGSRSCSCCARKWPFVVNNILFIVLELATGFCNTYTQFLWVRAFFGIAMGGLYGNVAATALEDCPPAARGIISGMMQQGYAFGYLLAVVFARALVDTTSHGWRPLFWFGACPPVLIIIARLYLPETKVYQERQAVREATPDITKTFIAEGKVAFKRHWMLLTYLVLLMAGFNFMSHGSQDLYPTMLKNQFEFSADEVTVTQVVANLGAITGGTLVMIAAFFEQFCVQGAWGVVPIHLMELSPPSYSTLIVGTSYQLGNLISSASSTIEARLGENYPLPPTEEGVSRYEYGKVICIFMAVVYAYLVLLTFLGPEARGKEFDVAHDRIWRRPHT